MDLPATLIALSCAAAIFGWANWRQRRDRSKLPGEGSLMPLTLIQMAAVVAVVVLTGHLVTLATGIPFRGRMSY